MSEQQLNSLAKALAADEATFRAFADATPNFVWLCRADGSAVFFNREALAYTALSQKQAVAQGFNALMHPDDVPSVSERWQAALGTGCDFEAELRLRSGTEGTYRWFLSRAKAVRGPDGRVAYWIGVSTGIDEQKRAVENLDSSSKHRNGLPTPKRRNASQRIRAPGRAAVCRLVLHRPQG